MGKLYRWMPSGRWQVIVKLYHPGMGVIQTLGITDLQHMDS
jgi:hypothetical protein